MDKTTKAQNKTTKPIPSDRAFHPLFPVPMGADPADVAARDISWLYVWRDREMLRECPLPREALQDERSIFERWGGGVYEIKAKDSEQRGWTANVTIAIKGPRLPFNADDPPPAAATASPAYPPTNPDSVVGTITALVSVATPLLTAYLDHQNRRDEQRRRDEERRDEQRRRDEERREDERRRLDEQRLERDRAWQQHQIQAQAEQTRLMLGLVQNNTGATQVVSALKEGLQLGQQLNPPPDDDGLGTIGEFIGSFHQARQAQQNRPS